MKKYLSKTTILKRSIQQQYILAWYLAQNKQYYDLYFFFTYKKVKKADFYVNCEEDKNYKKKRGKIKNEWKYF